MYSLVFTRDAVKTLRKMPRNMARNIRGKLDILARNPYAPNANARPLKERPGFRLRIGDWRVIYAIDDEQIRVLIVKIATRGKVYK
jgi:mRNA interferase RelE/StbE